jgi:uncharacterized membrane protein YjjB (DUF3815 family)
MTVSALLVDAFWSAVAALGFAILFNIPKRTLWACALMGATGYTLRAVLLNLGLTIELATLTGAAAIGFLGTFMARRFHMPIVIFTIPSAIPLVPGTFAFRTMIGILQLTNQSLLDDALILTEATTNGIKTGLILAALAAGIAAPKLLFQRRKPVV